MTPCVSLIESNEGLPWSIFWMKNLGLSGLPDPASHKAGHLRPLLISGQRQNLRVKSCLLVFFKKCGKPYGLCKNVFIQRQPRNYACIPHRRLRNWTFVGGPGNVQDSSAWVCKYTSLNSEQSWLRGVNQFQLINHCQLPQFFKLIRTARTLTTWNSKHGNPHTKCEPTSWFDISNGTA